MKKSPFVSTKFIKTFLCFYIVYKELDVNAFLAFFNKNIYEVCKVA